MKRILRAAVPAMLIGLVLLSLAAQIFLRSEELSRAPWWEHMPGFFSLFGFIGCLVLIAAALWLGRACLRKRERYYDDE